MKDYYGCPVQASINVLSGKWKVQILWHLSFGSRRFAEIRKKLPKISEKVLTDQLRQLERDGVLNRKVNSSVPPRVTYSLNDEGTAAKSPRSLRDTQRNHWPSSWRKAVEGASRLWSSQSARIFRIMREKRWVMSKGCMSCRNSVDAT